jgi:hypothetical protein
MALSAKIERAPGMTRAPNLCQPMDQHRSASAKVCASPFAAQDGKQLESRFLRNRGLRGSLFYSHNGLCAEC